MLISTSSLHMYSVLYYFHEILLLCISFLSSILLGATAKVNETAKNFGDEKQNPSGEDDVVADGNKENPTNEAEQKEPENKRESAFKASNNYPQNLLVLVCSAHVFLLGELKSIEDNMGLVSSRSRRFREADAEENAQDAEN
ncbi:hypothetical protein JHK87_016064 [Glycine soja]|nr:hypothetical protein JHK87_016064 [Glycine soja]